MSSTAPPDFERRRQVCVDIVHHWTRKGQDQSDMELYPDVIDLIADLYNSKFYGEERGELKVFDLKKANHIMIRHGSSIDAIGPSLGSMFGGRGGKVYRMGFERILSIGGQICIFGEPYLSQILLRTEERLLTLGGNDPGNWKPQYTFMINAESDSIGLEKLIVYSDGYCICGIWAE